MRAVMLTAAIALAGCVGKPPSGPAAGDDAERGRLLLRQYGCGTCHIIRGVAGAEANVGPPLTGVARRVYLAGTIPNSPESMALWIRMPQRFKPGSAMPDMLVSESQARDMVAFLYRDAR